MKKIIAVTEGDGVGKEVIPEGIKVIKTIDDYTEFDFEFKEAPAGGAVWKQCGESLPEKSFETIKASDALLFGAIGIPGLPQGVAEIAILNIRQGLDLYVNLRPIKLYEALRDRCPLKEEFIGDGINIYFVRENTEGLYAGSGGFLKKNTLDEIAVQESINTRKGVERCIRYAFEHCHKKTGRKN